MNQKASSRLGLILALVAGLGAWFSVTPVHPFTIHVLDLLWIYLVFACFAAIFFRGFGIPILAWVNPVAAMTFSAFMFALILAPMLGVLFLNSPLSGLSSSLRFGMFASFPVLFSILRVKRSAFLHGFERGLWIAVAINFFYAALQALEFNGLIPSGVLPHNTIGRALTGRSFSNWGRATGLFLEGNHLAYFGLFAVTFFWARFLLRPRFRSGALTVLALSLPVLGNSRSALLLSVLAVLLMLVTVLLLRGRANPRTLALTSLSLLAGILTAQVLLTMETLRNAVNFSRIQRVLALARGDLVADNSFRIRVEELWPAARTMVVDYPLGTGVEPSILIGTIDSAWITYFLQGSLPLVILFGIFLVGTAWSGYQTLREARSTTAKAAGHSLIWVAFVIAIGSLVLSPHHTPSMMVLFLCLYYVVAGRSGGKGDA